MAEDDDETDLRSSKENNEEDSDIGSPDLPWHPVDERGREIPPHPDDPRFNPDGSPKEEWFVGNGAKRGAGRNSRYNPETGEFEYYADLPDYTRDPDTGRWTKRAPADGKDDDGTREKEGTRHYPDMPPPMPPVGEDPKTRRGRQAFGQWLLELGVWGEQERQRRKNGER